MSSSHDNPYASPSAAGYEPEYKDSIVLATRWERFAGALLDVVAQTILLAPPMIAIEFWWPEINNPDLPTQLTLFTVTLLLDLASFLLLNGYVLATKGQTLGKLVLNTRIVSDANERMPLLPLILRRYLPFMALAASSNVGAVLALLEALFIFRPNRKCLHDDFAGTKVIKIFRAY